MEINNISSSDSNKISLLDKFPLFGLTMPELSSNDNNNNNRALYDNVLHYCLNPPNDSNSIYAKFDFRHRSLNLKNQDEQFEKRCANYDNLSYLVVDGLSLKRSSNRGNPKIASCKDYFAATNRFIFNENRQCEYEIACEWWVIDQKKKLHGLNFYLTNMTVYKILLFHHLGDFLS